MKNSVVWYSQQITQPLGTERFAGYVRAFGYGNQDVAGTPGKQDGRAIAFVHQIQDQKTEEISAGLRARDAFLGELPALLDEIR